jgi:hypothetical protein
MVDLHFLIRYLHITAMALMLGGALLLWWLCAVAPAADEETQQRLMLSGAQRYELIFWLALGVIAMTGVGNLGAFGAALPGPQSVWGAKFIVKIGLVLLFILASLVRTLVVSRIVVASSAALPSLAVFQFAYGGTTLGVLAILLLAVSLAHGG